MVGGVQCQRGGAPRPISLVVILHTQRMRGAAMEAGGEKRSVDCSPVFVELTSTFNVNYSKYNVLP